MKYIILLISLLSCLFLKAQDDFFNPYFHFSENEEVYIVENNTKLFEKADQKSKFYDKLPIGTAVTIKSMSNEISEIDGIRAPWYLVSYKKNAIENEGFVWGGTFSLYQTYNDNGSALKFIYGISAPKKKDGPFEIRCFALKNNSLIGKISFFAIGDLYYQRSLRVSKSLGVEGIENMLSFEYKNNYYIGEYGEQILFWNGKKFIFVKNLKNLGDPPCYSTETFIYPEEKEGKSNLILFKTVDGCYDDEGTVKAKVTEFKWEKNRLIFQKDYKIE